jgi:S-(hydroxymethyl)glutathione dehydrogenase/alcohol dehydrogenase
MRMRAAVLEEFGRPLVVQELDLEEPKTGEVLVRLVACGVCHTDMYTASGVDPSGYAPAVLGHEGAGLVEAVGEGVDSLAVGDHVVTLFSPQCRECVHCESPKTNICLAIRDQQGRGYLPDETTRACLFACGCRPVSAPRCTRPRSRRARRASSSGRAGLGAVAGCRLQGAARIVCVDLSPERLEMARHQGATDVLLGGPDTVDAVLEMTGGFGADYTIEATGLVSVMRQAVESARVPLAPDHARRVNRGF